MPELPEVETIRRGLELGVVGQRVTGVDVAWPKVFVSGQADVEERLIDSVVSHVGRLAKILVLELDNGWSLLFHLKMTGQLVLAKSDGERFAGGHPTGSMVAKLPDRSTRLMLRMASGDRLFFNDQRKFGWVKLIPSQAVAGDVLVARLGPEPLSEAFTAQHLAAKLARHARAPVKAIILDQSTVSGIGNIYADESLHAARIHPARVGGSLTDGEAKRLHRAIREILALAIEHGGTSFTNYVNVLGQRGDYLEHARVFRRQGQACGACGTMIEKMRLAGRGTHYCPRCQSRGSNLLN